MALNPKFSTGFRNTLIDGGDITTMFDGGELHIFAGVKPNDADQSESQNGSQTILAKVLLPGTNAFAASASAGAIAKAGSWTDASADASGTAVWFRLYANAAQTGLSTTAVRIDGTVGTADADLILTTTSIAATDPVTVDTFSIALLA